MIERAENDKWGAARWLCRCDCGNLKTACGKKLRQGTIKSCGCLQKETRKNAARTHGGGNTRLYRIWKSMRGRCYNAHSINFHLYGGRGITVCQEWKDSFEAFRDWALTHGYRDDLTIDRRDNDKGYFPGNCRWIYPKEQANNRRTCRTITLDGETHTVSEWAHITGLSKSTIKNRLDQGWSAARALTEPIHEKHRKKK